jgi:hypothetical protein
MPRDEVDRFFPKLRGKDIDLSPKDFNNNCLAFALGDKNNWWEPPAQYGFYWPPGFSEDTTIKTVEEIIRLHGFTIETDPSVKPKTDSIAIYGEHGQWKHFAKFADGIWSSKLGESHDVERIDYLDLEIADYGKCVKILSRPTQKKKK